MIYSEQQLELLYPWVVQYHLLTALLAVRHRKPGISLFALS